LGEEIQDRRLIAGDDAATLARPTPIATPIEVALPGLPTMRGQRWGAGAPAALLLHEPGADLDAWGVLPALLARRLEAAIDVLDLPGHGLSDDPWEPARLADLLAALRDHAGSMGPAIVAAGDTAGVALALAASLRPAAIVALSPAGFDPADSAIERSPRVPKLLFAGAHDGDALARARLAANTLGGWAVVSSVPTAERGAAILAGRWGASVADDIAGFLREALTRRKTMRD
jgi:hypothetical protein